MKTQKTSFLNFITILCFVILFTSCSQDENDIQKPEEKKIQYLESVPGGCNDQLKSGEINEESPDTVIVDILNDTLSIFAGLNYICCAPFVTECNLVNDSIFITISDTCTISDIDGCYCRCTCYYTFDYYFTNIDNKKYYWQIILNDPREENPIVFNSGEFGTINTE